MRAVVITAAGGPEVLSIREVAEPEVGPDDVSVRVRASALNRADVLQRLGRYPAPSDAPTDIPGLEFAGEVLSLGRRVASLRPGDRVMGLLGGGGHAEIVRVHPRMCLPIPPAIDWIGAAAIPEAFLTAADALFDQGSLGAGEAVLIHAAGSGVGTAAVQLAAAAGARVVALSRTPSKRRRLLELGAERAFDPGQPDVATAVLRAVGGEGIDLALDLVGAAALDLNLKTLRPRGRIVVVGLLSGSRVELDLGRLIRRRLRIVGTVLRSRPLEEKIALTTRFGRRFLPLLAAGRLRPVVDRVFGISDVAEAHAYLESDRSFGKIVLEIG